MSFFVSHPIRAWIVAAALLGNLALAAGRQRSPVRRSALVLAVAGWVAYGFWELHAARSGWTIRPDLFLIDPVLLGLTAAALLVAWDTRNR